MEARVPHLPIINMLGGDREHSVTVGIEVHLRDERGGTVRGLPDPAGGTFDAAGDFDGLIPYEDRSFRLLCYVDPYGDTVFNTVQMADLLIELERLAALDPTPIEMRGLERLRVIAKRCRDEPHSYVWFIGD